MTPQKQSKIVDASGFPAGMGIAQPVQQPGGAPFLMQLFFSRFETLQNIFAQFRPTLTPEELVDNAWRGAVASLNKLGATVKVGADGFSIVPLD